MCVCVEIDNLHSYLANIIMTCATKLTRLQNNTNSIRYKICRDCFIDAQKETGTCPGCKEPYKVGEYEDDGQDYSNGALQLPGPNGSKNNMSLMNRNQNGEFDQNKWLFETKGTYGVGNAYWPPDDSDDEAGLHEGVFDGSEKPWKPLCRRTPIPNGIITPYRLVNVMYNIL